MKKVISLLTILYIFSFISILESANSSIQALALKVQHQQESTHYLKNEGFLPQTLIATPNGLIPIENLNINDTIIGYSTNGDYCEQIITDISVTLIPYSIKITTQDEVICAGSHQKFYISQEKRWVSAKNLQPYQCLSNNQNVACYVLNIEKIEEPTTVYKLTTSHHLFCITSDHIVVHNAAPALATLAIGSLITVNPVVATLGTTLALGAVAAYLYDSLFKSQVPDTVKHSFESLSSDELYSYERQYYEQRRSELLKFKQNFVDIKKGLEKIGQLYRKEALNFTADFFEHLTLTSSHLLKNIPLPHEQTLNEQQKSKLRKARETELLALEAEIIELQTALVFHFNELIERLQRALQRYEQHSSLLLKTINDWNNSRKNITEKLALQNYEASLRGLHLIEIIEARISELKVTTDYYKAQKKSIITQTSNLMEVVKAIEKEICVREKSLTQNKQLLLTNKFIEENYLSACKINVHNLQKQILQNIAAETQHLESEAFAYLLEKYSQKPCHAACLLNYQQKHDDQPCPCGCSSNKSICACPTGCPCNKKQRKINTITKTEFFNCHLIKDNYAHYRNGMYKLKPAA
ncbi:MAG: hypothetical protein WA432_00645 [Candidatus Babeliaceae bacterium]